MRKGHTHEVAFLSTGYARLNRRRPRLHQNVNGPPQRRKCSLLRLCMTAEREFRILVLGGTGRVGTETIKALARITPAPLAISVAGRNVSRGRRICRQLEESNDGTMFPVHYNFSMVDINDWSALPGNIADHDMVIHTAGPFQRKERPDAVLRAAMEADVPYMDVCDDITHAMQCKELHSSAREKGFVGLISTGIYPGLSNLMAVEAVRQLEGDDVKSLQLNYHTAGTGGIGATVLASTFLILSEKAVCYDAGQAVYKPAAGLPQVIDFRGGIGKRTVYLLNLPEVVSLYEHLLASSPGASVCAKFSTGPPIWNWLLQAMAKWTPSELLANREAMLAFSQFSLPVVRAVDLLSGARTGIQVTAAGQNSSVTMSFEHERLSECVGEATAAFAHELIKSKLMATDVRLEPGIYFPEELSAEILPDLFRDATRTANFFSYEKGS